jgi:hypothetical protein
MLTLWVIYPSNCELLHISLLSNVLHLEGETFHSRSVFPKWIRIGTIRPFYALHLAEGQTNLNHLMVLYESS